MSNTDGGENNLVLRYLLAIERKVDRLIDNVRDLKERVPALQAGLALVLDRMETRLDRIERRLELTSRGARARRGGAGGHGEA
jgi:hypothetical protein